jgi:hypothetical protein
MKFLTKVRDWLILLFLSGLVITGVITETLLLYILILLALGSVK